MSFYLFYFIVCLLFFVISQEGKSWFFLYRIIVFLLHLHDCCLFITSPYIHAFFFFEGAITYLRATGLFYTHLLFIILFQIAADSAVPFKIKWPTKYSTLQVNLTYTVSLYMFTYIKLCGSLKKMLRWFLLEFCTSYLGGVAKKAWLLSTF